MYCITKIAEDKTLIGRIEDNFWLTLNSKDFSITLTGCELLMPYKNIKCENIAIEMKLLKKPKGFQPIPLDLLVKSDDFETFYNTPQETFKFDKILIFDGNFWSKKKTLDNSSTKKTMLKTNNQIPNDVELVDGLLQYKLTF
jgi:hypothetical protein